MHEQSYQKAIDRALEKDDEQWMPPDMLAGVKGGAAEYAEVLKELARSGRLVMRSFDDTLAKVKPLLDDATNQDMRDVTRWTRPIQASISEWSTLVHRLRDVK